MICVYLFYFSFILVLYLHFVRNKRNYPLPSFLPQSFILQLPSFPSPKFNYRVWGAVIYLGAWGGAPAKSKLMHFMTLPAKYSIG